MKKYHVSKLISNHQLTQETLRTNTILEYNCNLLLTIDKITLSKKLYLNCQIKVQKLCLISNIERLF